MPQIQLIQPMTLTIRRFNRGDEDVSLEFIPADSLEIKGGMADVHCHFGYRSSGGSLQPYYHLTDEYHLQIPLSNIAGIIDERL